jgi:Fe-S-cluster containining protein
MTAARKPVTRPKACQGCSSLCCRYFAVGVAAPRNAGDFDTLRWFVLHKGVSLLVESDGQWWMMVANRCKNLLADNTCRDYPHRPAVCRKHDPRTCEFTLGRPYTTRFDTPEQLDRYQRSLQNPGSRIKKRRRPTDKDEHFGRPGQ